MGLKSLFILLTAFVMLSCSADQNSVDEPGLAPDVEFTALTSDNRIAYYHARNLDSPVDIIDITGLPSGETIVSIDYRPATGQLYALGAMSRLYVINEESGQATPLGSSSFSPSVEGDNASIDFNPTVDRIRLVTQSGQNLRLHPESGTVVAEDGEISGEGNPQIGAVAYTNSVAGASSTELYDIDFSGNKLFIQDPPNDGGLQEVGDLGVDFKGQGNFDINPDNSTALAVTLDGSESRLFTINLSTGRAEWAGTFSIPVKGIAFKTDPVAFATTEDNMLYRFNPVSPVMNAVELTGLMPGESILGLDFRPVNGALYAISDQNRLLTVNTANGEVASIGAGLGPATNCTAAGFDFNPTVDRIRLVCTSGENFRLHPDLGTIVEEDGRLNPGDPAVSGAAYTNNFADAAATLLYVIDSEQSMLYIQDPPNDGVLVPVGPLGVDFTEDNGFDIGGSSNEAFALLRTNDGTGIYSINLDTGEAVKIADFNINANSMALGLGF